MLLGTPDGQEAETKNLFLLVPPLKFEMKFVIDAMYYVVKLNSTKFILCDGFIDTSTFTLLLI